MIDVARLAVPPIGNGVALKAFDERYREGLRAACVADPDIWPIYPVSWDRDHFDASFDAQLADTSRIAFIILQDDRVVGMSAYMQIDVEQGTLEIGGTYIAPDLRGSGFNAGLKDLMIGHAFACGVRRIGFRVDRRNLRSQAAVEKIGGVREGVLRADRVTWTGYVRDTVLYSILASEWPRV